MLHARTSTRTSLSEEREYGNSLLPEPPRRNIGRTPVGNNPTRKYFMQSPVGPSPVRPSYPLFGTAKARDTDRAGKPPPSEGIGAAENWEGMIDQCRTPPPSPQHGALVGLVRSIRLAHLFSPFSSLPTFSSLTIVACPLTHLLSIVPPYLALPLDCIPCTRLPVLFSFTCRFL